MGTDLLSACIFCAGFLFGAERAPFAGVGGEFAVSYATLARRYDIGGGKDDISDVTPKFVLIGIGGARAAGDGFGAGTPAGEWRLRVALAPSHDEQNQRPIEGIGRTIATGTGRYENFAVLLRYPLTARDSIEAAWNRRSESATDLLNLGGQNFVFSEQRVLSAERVDVALGWRHRWRGFEAALSANLVRPNASDTTAGSFSITSGKTLAGGGAEARALAGQWTILASAQRASGSVPVHEESAPRFAARDFDAPASLEAYRIGAGYSWARTDVFLVATYDRSRLPFVALAVLGTEAVAIDGGFHPDSRSRQLLLDLSVARSLSRGSRVRAFLRWALGDETVTLTDSAGVAPERRLDVRRSGLFGRGLSGTLGSPELTFGLGADFLFPRGWQ